MSSYYNSLARIVRGAGCSLTALLCELGRGSTSWWDRGTGVGPTQPLTLTLTPNRTQNGPERTRNAAAPLLHLARKLREHSEVGPRYHRYPICTTKTSPEDPCYWVVRCAPRRTTDHPHADTTISCKRMTVVFKEWSGGSFWEVSRNFTVTTIGVRGNKVVRKFGITKIKRKRRSRVSRPFLGRFGSGWGSGVGLRVGLGLHPYLDPTRKCFLARNQRTTRPLEDSTGHSVINPHILYECSCGARDMCIFYR